MSAVIPRRRRSPWWWLLLVPVGAAVILPLSGVIKLPSSASSQAATSSVETATAERSNFRVSVSGPGTLEASESLDVKPSVNGTVALVPKVGQRVTKGELIARLDPSSFQRALETAQLNLDKALAQLSGTRATQSSNRASQQQSIASAQTQYSNAQRDVQSAQVNYSNAKKLFDIGGGTLQSVRDAQTALDKAQSALSSSLVSLQTAQGAVGLKAQSDTQDLRNLELAVQQAQISVKNAREDLASTKVYAPMNGVVSSVSAQLGSPASSGGAMFTLLNDHQVNLPAQVDETEIGKVKLGQSADVTLDALDGQIFHGKVSRISPQATISNNIAVFYVTITIDNPDLLLRPGMSAEAEIVAQEILNTVLIPRRAVENVRTRSYVMVQVPGQTEPERTRVTTGPDDGTNIVITSGLRGGETIVLPTRTTTTTTNTRNNGGLRIPIGGAGR